MAYDIKETFHYDEALDRLTIHRQQDFEPLIEENRVMRDELKEVPGLGYLAGRLPMVLVEEYMKRKGITFHEFMSDDSHVRFLLQNRDLSKLKVWEGKW
jgi:hypothetical protein